MPKYYFDCFDEEVFHPDKVGIELPNVDEAAEHGACLAVTLIGEAPPSVGMRSVSVRIRSAEGGSIYTANCSFSGIKHTAPSKT